MKTSVEKVECLTPDIKWLKLYRATYINEFPDTDYSNKVFAKTGHWDYVSRKTVVEAISGVCRPDAVVIVPIIKEAFTMRAVLLKEFRIPINDYIYAFPAGILDPNETIEDCAKRELKEETGLDLNAVTYVSPPLYSSAGLTDESVVIVYADVSGIISNDGHESTENIEVISMNQQELLRLVYRFPGFEKAKFSARFWLVAKNLIDTETLKFAE